MPRQIDLFPQNLQVKNDPTKQLGVTAAQINHLQDQIPAALAAAEIAAVNSFLQSLDKITGLDLVGWWKDTQDLLNLISASQQQSWLNFQNFLNGLAQQTDADVAGALAWVQGQFNQLYASLQQSWLSFQNLINSVVGGVDKDVTDLIAALNSTGGDAATARANWDTLFLDLGFSVTTASQLASWLGGTNTTATNNAAYASRKAKNDLIIGDWLHATYPVGSITDTAATLVGGKRTWWGAWNDNLTLLGIMLGIVAPTDPASDIGGVLTTHASNITTAQNTANTATTNASTAQTTANTNATRVARKAQNDLIIGDWLHATYPLGSSTDTAATLVGGKRTWWGAWNDNLILLGILLGITAPTDPASDVGTTALDAQSTASTASTTASAAQSTATTASTNASTAITNAAAAQSTATTANTAAGTAQTTANTANTMFGLGQQAGTNLVLAPGFESAAAWTSASAGTQSTVQAHSGTNSWMLQGTGTGNITTLRLINNSSGPTTLKSRAGEVFQLQAFVYPKSGNAGGGTVAVQIVCTDSTGVNSATTLVAATETVPATGSWSSLSGTAVVPTGYDTVDPQLILLSVPTTDFVYVDDVLVRETTLVTTAQSTATAASANASSALSQLTAVPQQTVVPNLMAGASSVTFDSAGSGGSATNSVGSVSTPLTATGTQTIGSTADLMVAAVTYSLVGPGNVIGNSIVAIGSQQMQRVGRYQLPSVTEFVEFLILWNPPTGSAQAVTATAQSFNGGVASVSFETASYSGVTNVSIPVTNSGTGASLTLSVPSAVAGTMAVNAFSAGDVVTKATTALSAYTKTSRGNTTVSVNSTQYGYQSLVLGDTAGGSGGVTFGATGANSSAEWLGVGVVLSATSTLGSGLRQSRTSTGTASAPTGNVPLNIYDTTPLYKTSDLSISSGVATVTVAGHYMVTISQLEASVTTVHQARILLYQNGSVVQQGQTMNVTTTASNTWIMQSTFIVYCNANDTLQPGAWFSTSPGFALTGEATGTCTYWEVALVNRSLL